jgi:hypothetical protein
MGSVLSIGDGGVSAFCDAFVSGKFLRTIDVQKFIGNFSRL